MTNTKSTKRALLASVMAMLLCFTMLLGTTFAWFTDSVTSGNNIIKSGNLDIELEYYEDGNWQTVDGATDLFEGALWEPGHTEVAYLRLSNIGTLALKYELGINIVSEKSGTNLDGEEFFLSEYIYMGVVENVDGETAPYDKTDAGRAKAVADIDGAGIISEGYVSDGTMTADQADRYMAVVVYMPTDVTNEANYKFGTEAPEISLGINLIATQLDSESDSFSNDYDKDAKYSISVGEKVILNGNKFDNALENRGEATLNNIEINANGGNALYNEGTAELKDATLNMTGSTGYITNSRTDGSVTIYENVTATSSGGGVNVWQGKAVFKSGTITTNSTSTSARHMFYVADGAELVIEDGEFFFNPTNLTRKGSYICADVNSKVIVKGGTFHKPSTRTAPIQELSGATVEIYGGTFAFDPSEWVAEGCKVINDDNTKTWYVVANDVTGAASLDDVKNAFATGGKIILTDDIALDDVLYVENGANVHLNMNGKTMTAGNGIDPEGGFLWVKDGSSLTIEGNGTFDLGANPGLSFLVPQGEVVIENGTFIREVAAGTNPKNVGAMFVGTKTGKLVINGGYFDGGYYDANAELAFNGGFTETADDIAKHGQPGDTNLVRVALKNNISKNLNLSAANVKIYGGTFVGVNPAWGDEGCALPITPDYLRPWSYYQGAFLDGQQIYDDRVEIPEGYTITEGTTEDGRPTYTVSYNK